MAIADDDRDEAYHSGLYSLQSKADSTEMAKGLGSAKNKGVGRSPSPGTGVKQTSPISPITNRPAGSISIKNLGIQAEGMKKSGDINLETPMSNLAGRLIGVNLARTSTCESPTSDYESGFPSMPESAYGSLSAPTSMSHEKRSESPTNSPVTKETERMDVEEDSGTFSMSAASKLVPEEPQSNEFSSPLSVPIPKPRQNIPATSPVPTSLSSLQAQKRTRSLSPSVPPVAESVEVFTEVPSIVHSKPEISTRSKRAIESDEVEMWPHKKTPRLSDVASMEEGSGMSQKAIRVKTIVSPAGSPRPHRKRGVSPHRSPRDSHSPVSISVSEEKNMDTSPVKLSSPSPGSLSPSSSTQQPCVNFRDIGDLAKSDKPEQGLMYVTVHPTALQAARVSGHTPILLGVNDIARRGGQTVSSDSVRITPKGAVFLDSRSPKRGNSPVPPASTAAVFQLLTTGQGLPLSSSPGRISPAHSPRSSVTTGSPSSDKKEDGSKASDKKEDKDGKPGAGNALLQVTEAHLATLSDEDGDTPLHLAIIHENVGLTQYLVKLIVGVYMNLDIANNMRQTPLHLAVITRQPQMVQLLVGAGASVNFPDRKGNTALHLAAARRDVRILQLLAQATNPLPDYNAKNFYGLTAVHVATKEASIDVLKFFFQMGANKNAPDACSGRTALHYAVEAENFTLVNFLLENNVNVNAATFSGNTPLHVAAGRRLKEIVALLMAYGANPAIANGEGDFPSDLPASLLMQRAKMHNAH